MRVVDASVVLGWLLTQLSPESGPIIEDHIAGREPLVAPDLLGYEVANVLVAGARLPVDVAVATFQRFAGLGIEQFAFGTAELEAAMELAARFRVSAYDASYVVLAGALGCRLITADRRLARAIRILGIADLAS